MVTADAAPHDEDMTDHGPASPGGPGASMHAPPPPPPAPRTRLKRRTDDKVIAGVCSGVGAYLGVDPVLVRIAVVMLTLAGLSGVVLYIVGWIVMPEARPGEPLPPPAMGENGRRAGAAVLLVAALLLLMAGPATWGDRAWWPGRGLFLPLLFLGAGIYLLLRDTSGDAPPGAPGPSGGTPPGGGDWAAGSVVGGWASDAAAPPAAPPPTGPVPSADAGHTDPDHGSHDRPDGTGGDGDDLLEPTARTEPVAAGVGGGDHYGAPWPGSYQAHPPPPPAAYRRDPERASLTWPTIGILLAGFGLVAILGNIGAVRPSALTVLAGALVVVGGALVVAAWYGRARGLIAVGLAVTLLLTAGTALDVPARGGAGERLYAPASVAEVRDEYRLFAGEMRIDLRGLDDLGPGDELTLEASVAMGELTVLVPEGATVVVDARAGAGEVHTFGRVVDGLGVDERAERAGGGEIPPLITLDLRVGLGQVEVR
jgi:phage shock protein PspC (stress-responsive transcriptional regulator)